MKESRKRELTFAEKSYCSLIAGFLGSIIGTPPDLALIRMQADSNLPVDERRNYKVILI
jgi:solute carrier family 25 oxoglutarate transporter 11